MRRRAPSWVAVCGILLILPACGGSSSSSSAPTAPQPVPAPTPTPAAETPTVIDGWTDGVLAVQTTPATVSTGQRVEVSAPGFLPRVQTYAGAPIALWPAEPSYVQELVYDWELGDGNFAMVRWSGPFTVTLSDELAADPAIVAKAQEVVQELSRWTGFPITLGPDGLVTVVLDPTVEDEGAVAEARVSLLGAEITRAEVAFAHQREVAGGRDADFSNTLLHEMGHVVGLSHSPDERDVMTPGAGPGTFFQEFQTNEAIALHMMYGHRVAGNRPPDTEEGVGAAAARVPRLVVIRD